MRGLNAPPRRIVAPAGCDRLGRLEELLAALDGAGAGHDRQGAVADHGVEHPDDGVLAVELARRQLEGLADRRDGLDAGQLGQAALQLRAAAEPDFADDRDHEALLALVLVGREALGQDVALDPDDLGFAGGDGHHHEHQSILSLVVVVEPRKKQRSKPLLHPGTTRAPGSGSGSDHAGHR